MDVVCHCYCRYLLHLAAARIGSETQYFSLYPGLLAQFLTDNGDDFSAALGEFGEDVKAFHYAKANLLVVLRRLRQMQRVPVRNRCYVAGATVQIAACCVPVEVLLTSCTAAASAVHVHM